MANPLFNAIMGGSNAHKKAPVQTIAGKDNAGVIPSNGQQMTNMRDAMTQLKNDPSGMLKQAGFNVPDEYASNPQQAVMHLIQSGQVGGPMMRMIQPMINRMMGRR